VQKPPSTVGDVFVRHERAGIFLLCLAACCFALDSYLVVETVLFLRTAVQTDGTVVENREEFVSARGGGYMTYVPIVEFTANDGIVRSVEASAGSREPAMIGGSVPVFYPPNYPQRARIGGYSLWHWSACSAASGTFFLLLGLLGANYRRLHGRMYTTDRTHA
jgi:hypothetical protein